MLIIRSQKKTKFVSKSLPVKVYLVDIIRNKETDELEYVYRLDVSVKTLQTVKAGISMIKVLINLDAIRKPATRFERMETYGIPPFQTSIKVQQINAKGIQTMEFIDQTETASKMNEATAIKTKVSTTMTKEEYVNECLLNFASEISSKQIPTHQGKQDMLITNEEKYPNSFRGKSQEEIDYAFVTTLQLDSIIKDFSKINKLKLDPASVFNMKNGKITGQSVGDSIKHARSDAQINTMSGAMTVRTSPLDNYFDNEVLLNQISDIYKNIYSRPNLTSYTTVCYGLIKNGISPTSVVASNVDDIITSKMIYNGTGIAT